MPLFDFRCRACGHAFETLVRAGTEPACPNCAARDLERLVSLTAPQGTSRQIIASARRAAAREGHFSHYSKKERRGLG